MSHTTRGTPPWRIEHDSDEKPPFEWQNGVRSGTRQLHVEHIGGSGWHPGDEPASIDASLALASPPSTAKIMFGPPDSFTTQQNSPFAHGGLQSPFAALIGPPSP
jgi:hypothetical protein